MVRTRIPPSPTGEDLHVGNLYTALINWAFARKNKGKFIIRIEDTDRTRFVEGAEEKILSSLKAFGLNYDEGPDVAGPFGPYRQSQRVDVYKKYVKQLIERGQAYYCFCTKERLSEMRKKQIENKQPSRYDRYCLNSKVNIAEKLSRKEQFVVRLKVPDNLDIVFKDLLRGEIKINSSEIDDQVLLKADGFPTYHLGVVIDDHLMEISHIIRAEEWISSTPKHVLLYQAFGWEMPVFVHLPILRNPDRTKLSKRKNPVWVSWYLKNGFLPEAVLNYLALLGWSHPEGKEIFGMDEFVDKFRLEDINPVGPIFDVLKLRWLNQQYILAMTDKELSSVLLEFSEKAKVLEKSVFEKIVPLVKTRIGVLSDFDSLTRFFWDKFETKARDKKEKVIADDLRRSLSDVKDWNMANILSIFKEVMKEMKIRMPMLYYIFTGQETGLPLPESVEMLGKERTLKILNNFIKN